MTQKQTILGRVSQLAKANINALLDRAAPERLVQHQRLALEVRHEPPRFPVRRSGRVVEDLGGRLASAAEARRAWGLDQRGAR